MLAYAANGGELRGARFESRYPDADAATEALAEFLAGAAKPRYWERVGVDLRAGKLRLIFVADAIPRMSVASPAAIAAPGNMRIVATGFQTARLSGAPRRRAPAQVSSGASACPGRAAEPSHAGRFNEVAPSPRATPRWP
jgi:hypothetical protein